MLQQSAGVIFRVDEEECLSYSWMMSFFTGSKTTGADPGFSERGLEFVSTEGAIS